MTLCFLRFGDFKLPIPFQSLWKIIKLICVIQVFNAAMYYFVWVAYDYSVPSWTLATLTVFYAVLILAIKLAMDGEAGIQG